MNSEFSRISDADRSMLARTKDQADYDRGDTSLDFVSVTRDFENVKDSGKRQEFQTGSKRDTREGKGRFDLIPTYPLRRLARHYQNGADKYGDRNWEKGQPLSRYLDSCMRHLLAVMEGQTDEDHASAVSWNMFAYVATLQWIEQGKLPLELDDLNHATPKGKEQ